MRLSRASLERRVDSGSMGEAGRPILEAAELAHASAWDLAARLLDEEQLTRSRQAIDAWAEQLGDVDEDAVLTPPSIEEIAKTTETESGGGGLAGLLALDPLAGLEPTTREIALARLFAERALFVGKHAPQIVRAQLELAALQARQQPETAQLLRDIDEISSALEEFGGVAGGLPELVRTEREAAIAQVLDGLEAQREGLVRDLEAAQEPVDEILVSSRATLEAAQRTSSELNGLVTAVGTFLDRFEPEPGAEPEPAGPPARPFDITEYEAAVARLGDTARELTTLVAEIERSLPEVERMVDAAAQRGEQSIDHAFARALQLGLVLIAAAALAAFALRKLAPRARGA
jgi:hypothetical protein